MNTELVRAVFDCGIDDLRLLDDAECDMYAVIGRMREESIELTMNNIIQQVFEEGRYILTKAREEKIASLPAEPMTEADFELRENLERLNPEQDFSFWINLQDTNFRGKSELQELYESMFTEELDALDAVVEAMKAAVENVEYGAFAWDKQRGVFVPIGRPVLAKQLCLNRYQERVRNGEIPNWIDPEKFKILERTVAEIASDWKEAKDE